MTDLCSRCDFALSQLWDSGSDLTLQAFVFQSVEWWLNRRVTIFGIVLITCKLLLFVFLSFCLSGCPLTFGVTAG